MAWLAIFAFAIVWTEVFFYFQTSDAWHSELRGLKTQGAVWSVWTGRRAAGVARLASICCAWKVGLCRDVISSALTDTCSWVILAKRNVEYRGGQGGMYTSEAASSIFVSIAECGAKLWHLLLQLSCPCRQVQLCNPILSYPLWLGACIGVGMNGGIWFHIEVDIDEATHMLACGEVVYAGRSFMDEIEDLIQHVFLMFHEVELTRVDNERQDQAL
eukprot:1145251-Pelagomonas_calceolata.AAC.7